MRRVEEQEVVGGEGFTLGCSRLVDLGSRLFPELLVCQSWPDIRIMPKNLFQVPTLTISEDAMLLD